MNLKLATGKKI